jgi:3-oxoacyl-[acyl-carrier-protein] synthase-3
MTQGLPQYSGPGPGASVLIMNWANGVTTLERVEAYAPDRSVSIEEIAKTGGLNRYQTRMFQRIRGLDRIHSDPDLNLFDLLAAPALKLLRSVPDQDRIRYLIFAHTFPDLAPSFVIATDRLRERLGLENAESFALTQQNCASGLAALDMAGELLRADGDLTAQALVVTGEKPFTGLVQFLLNVSIMGEASAACLVGLNGEGSRTLSYAVRTAGEFSDGFRMDPEAQRDFGNTYNAYLLEVMEEALAESQLSLDDISMIIPHNVNLSSWLRLCLKVGFDRKRVFLDNVAEYSHCYCSDPFLNLVSMRERGLLVKGQLYMLTSVGIGSTYAAMIIEY